jgi:hypothetical protein
MHSMQPYLDAQKRDGSKAEGVPQVQESLLGRSAKSKIAPFLPILLSSFYRTINSKC